MAEQEITYIPYGQDEISQQDLMTSLADGIEGYLGSKRWARKEKNRQAWLNAYQDIMDHGLTGASNSTGVWRISHGKDEINLDNMSNLDKEMYMDAAYYIRQQMSRLTPRKKEEEKKQEDLEDFNFNNSFGNHLLTNYYRGNKDLLYDPNEGWDSLDTRDPNTGLRDSKNRKNRLIEVLTSYRDELATNKDKYKFDNSGFKDYNDVISNIDGAIAALRSPELDDDNPALNRLGLRSSTFFSNGGNDIYGTDKETGNPITYQQYYEALNKQRENEAKAKTEATKKKLAQQQANRYNYATRSSIKMIGRNPQELVSKYQNDQGLLQQLNKYAQTPKLTGDEWSDIVGAFNFYNSKGALQNLSKQELERFQGLRAYNGLGPGVLKKIPGVEGFYYDTRTGQVVKPERIDQQVSQPINGLLEQNSPQYQQQQYMNSTEGGFTPAEQREVAALLFDLGAAVDPEGVSSAGLSQIAAGIRDYNRATDPEGWTWGDTGWATLDHGLGLLSTIPVVGGLVKGSWAAAKLGKYIPKIEQWIRYVGRAGSTYAMAANAPGALNTLNKIKNGEDLSLKDYQDLAYFFIGGLGHHQLNRGNRVERSAMKARGIETSNSVLNKAGITRTKAKATNTSETTPTLKVQKTREDGKVETKEIPITKEQEAALKKANPGKLNEAATEAKIDNIPEGYKIVEPTINSNWRNRINTVKSWFRKGNSEIFGTPTTTTRNSSELKSNEEFEQYLSEHNNTWLKKIFNGSNRDIRRYDRYLGNNQPQLESKTETTKQEVAPKKELKGLPKPGETTKEIKFKKETINNYREHLKGNFSNEKLQSGDYNLNGNNLRVVEQQDGTFNIIYKGEIKGNYQKHQQKELQQKVFDLVKENRKTIDKQSGKSTKKSTAEIGKILQDLKKKGWLKQGGTINTPLDNIIEDFFKNNNI